MELEQLCEQWPDYPPRLQLQQFIGKSTVVHPGIQLPPERRDSAQPEHPLHLLWAARWEHDKGPADLLKLLRQLKKQPINFRLSVIGQSFRTIPNEFDEIKNEFSDNIVNWGFQASRQQYWEALASADVFLSTAKHEFFGLAACEAISAGLFPVLPNRLAYPELMSELARDVRSIFLYDQIADAIETIQSVDTRWSQFQELDLAERFQRRFDEAEQAKLMDQSILKIEK